MYLLDTNVVTEIRKVYGGKAHPNVAQWVNSINSSDAFLSVIALHELEIGVQLAEQADSRKAGILRSWIDDYVIPVFRDRLLEVSGEVAKASAQYCLLGPCRTREALMAATADIHKMTIVTRNTNDFAKMQIKLLNPWL